MGRSGAAYTNASTEAIPPRLPEPYNEHCFFGSNFTAGLIIMRTIKL